MNQNQRYEEFILNSYEPEREKFLEEIHFLLRTKAEEVCQEIKNKLELFIRAVEYGQEQLPVPIECIQMSLLYTSFYMDEPMLQFDAYGEMGVLGLRLFSKTYPFPFFKDEWLCLKERLREAVRKEKLTNFISEARIQQMMMEVVNMLQTSLYITTKYGLMDIKLDVLTEELICLDKFYLTIGGYMDHQTIIAADFPELDIFFHPEEEALDFRTYSNKIYQKKNFNEFDLKHSKFVECQFINCTFYDCNLRDVWFENCRFYHTEFVNCMCEGMTILDCMMEQIVFESTSFFQYLEGPQKGIDFYKPLDISLSRLRHIEMKHCDVRMSRFVDNDEIRIQIKDCDLYGSTMEGNVNEHGIFQIMSEQEDE